MKMWQVLYNREGGGGGNSRQWSIGGELGKSKSLCYRLSFKNSFSNCLTFTSKCIRVHFRWTLSWKNIATLIKVSEGFFLHCMELISGDQTIIWTGDLKMGNKSRDLSLKFQDLHTKTKLTSNERVPKLVAWQLHPETNIFWWANLIFVSLSLFQGVEGSRSGSWTGFWRCFIPHPKGFWKMVSLPILKCRWPRLRTLTDFTF